MISVYFYSQYGTITSLQADKIACAIQVMYFSSFTIKLLIERGNSNCMAGTPSKIDQWVTVCIGPDFHFPFSSPSLLQMTGFPLMTTPLNTSFIFLVKCETRFGTKCSQSFSWKSSLIALVPRSISILFLRSLFP